MGNRGGSWIGYSISAVCLGLIGFVFYSAWSGAEFSSQLFRSVCHQFSDRCYHLNGVALPVCVRCIWIYLGLAAGHTLFIYWKPETKRITRCLIGVIALMVLDVVLENSGLYHNWFWSRAVTGLLFGLIVSHFTLLGLREIYIELTHSKTYVRS